MFRICDRIEAEKTMTMAQDRKRPAAAGSETVPAADAGTSASLSRRQALTRLGLTAGAVYAAPSLLSLSEANADDRPPWGRPSRPSKPTRPSKKKK